MTEWTLKLLVCTQLACGAYTEPHFTSEDACRYRAEIEALVGLLTGIHVLRARCEETAVRLDYREFGMLPPVMPSSSRP